MELDGPPTAGRPGHQILRLSAEKNWNEGVGSIENLRIDFQVTQPNERATAAGKRRIGQVEKGLEI
jgi:hypothetical protein